MLLPSFLAWIIVTISARLRANSHRHDGTARSLSIPIEPASMQNHRRESVG